MEKRFKAHIRLLFVYNFFVLVCLHVFGTIWILHGHGGNTHFASHHDYRQLNESTKRKFIAIICEMHNRFFRRCAKITRSNLAGVRVHEWLVACKRNNGKREVVECSINKFYHRFQCSCWQHHKIIWFFFLLLKKLEYRRYRNGVAFFYQCKIHLWHFNLAKRNKKR